MTIFTARATKRGMISKNKVLHIRVTPQLDDACHAAAESTGLSVSEWLRAMLAAALLESKVEFKPVAEPLKNGKRATQRKRAEIVAEIAAQDVSLEEKIEAMEVLPSVTLPQATHGLDLAAAFSPRKVE